MCLWLCMYGLSILSPPLYPIMPEFRLLLKARKGPFPCPSTYLSIYSYIHTYLSIYLCIYTTHISIYLSLCVRSHCSPGLTSPALIWPEDKGFKGKQQVVVLLVYRVFTKIVFFFFLDSFNILPSYLAIGRQKLVSRTLILHCLSFEESITRL